MNDNHPQPTRLINVGATEIINLLRTKEDNSLYEKNILTPSNPVIKIESSTAINDAVITVQQVPEIYSLTGRKITSKNNLPKGVYIINGKKYIIK